ncbi:mitochondrial import inner membrane translocase subunit tim54 [Xylographa trunciseda]|nr:mitochondrial import inner membrane translocase subunit tim54 [Xylographa trunciseda]
MADVAKVAAEAPKPPAVVMPAAKAEGNPALRMMGLPRFRAKLPSRNWLIFLAITGSFTTALLYDRNQKKKAQRKWCDLVSHLARETLPVTQLPRKFTIFLSAPPGDGLRSAREYFQEYVKPVLVAAAVEWDVVEGRREGDVRAGLAERIRKLRRKNGEKAPMEQEEPKEDLVHGIQEKAGIRPSSDLEGDLIIGRHTWKEYVRGLQEGWLGPLHPPDPPPIAISAGASVSEPSLEDPNSDLTAEQATASESGDAPVSSAPSEAPPPPPKPVTPVPPYISPSQYPSSPLASTAPRALQPAVALPFPHILGILNTPIRTYRYLTQRRLADEVGHIVADMVLAKSTRPFDAQLDFASSIDPDSPSASLSSGEGQSGVGEEAVISSGTRWEQQGVYLEEEKEWHKSARKPNAPSEEGKERVWLEDMVIDERIGQRMTTFVNSMAQDQQVQKIADEHALQAADRQCHPGWIETIKLWTGFSETDGSAKGWEQGSVGDESE